MPWALVPRKDINNCADEFKSSAENYLTNNRDRSRSPIIANSVLLTNIDLVLESIDGDDTKEPIPCTSKAPNGDYDIV